MKSLPILLSALALFANVLQIQAQALYGATASGGPGRLYVISSTSGALVQDVGPLNDALGVNYPVTGLAFHPVTGVLYGSTGNNPATTAGQFVTINPATGLVIPIGAFNAGPTNNSGTPTTMSDLSFDAAGNLFGIGSIGGPQLYSINIANGQATLVGPSGLTSTSGGGLAISTTGIAYGTPTGSRFGTYDLSTGAYSNITNPVKPGDGAYAALAFNENGVLFGMNSGTGSPPPTALVTIDPTTGAVTSLGSSVQALDAIAFQPVPEPTTTALLIGSAAIFIGSRLRRRK